MISALDAGLLGLAGTAAGLIGTAGGITSLVSYPVLLAVGLSARTANVANLAAVVACWPGAALVSGPELAGQRARLRRWLPVTALGQVAGSVLLLSTSSALFARIVPFLVAGGALTLAVQPRLTARRARSGDRQGPPAGGPLLLLALLAVSVYGGYFGAGSGVMTLALLLAAAEPDLPSANALKNMLIGAGALVSAVVFALLGPVDWTAVAPLGAGMFLGSTLGPRVARRVPAGVLRLLVVLIGLGLAVQLWFDPTG